MSDQTSISALSPIAADFPNLSLMSVQIQPDTQAHRQATTIAQRDFPPNMTGCRWLLSKSKPAYDLCSRSPYNLSSRPVVRQSLLSPPCADNGHHSEPSKATALVMGRYPGSHPEPSIVHSVHGGRYSWLITCWENDGPEYIGFYEPWLLYPKPHA